MRVFLGLSDIALKEILDLPMASVRRALAAEIVVASLFTTEIVMPEVFLFNSPVFHSLVIQKRSRNYITEAINRNVIRLYSRVSQPGNYEALLTNVREDTLVGVPISRPLAIGPRAETWLND